MKHRRILNCLVIAGLAGLLFTVVGCKTTTVATQSSPAAAPARKMEPKPKTAAEIQAEKEREAKKIEEKRKAGLKAMISYLYKPVEDGFVIIDEELAMDLSTDILWMRQSYAQLWNQPQKKFPEKKQQLHNMRTRMHGKYPHLYYSYWRLPTVEELQTVYIPYGRGCTSWAGFGEYRRDYTYHWPPTFKCTHKPFDSTFAWAKDIQDGKSVAFNFQDGTHASRGAGYQCDMRLIYDGSLDMIRTISKYEISAYPLVGKKGRQTIDKMVTAYQTDLPDIGKQLYGQLNHQALYLDVGAEFYGTVLKNNLPLSMVSEAMNKMDRQKTDGLNSHWFRYARLSLQAGHPALALKAVDELARLNTPIIPEFTTWKERHMGLVKAVALMQMGQEKAAYGELFKISPVKDMSVVYAINHWGQALLKDKKKLAMITGVNEKLFTAKYKAVAQQPIHNLWTGKLLAKPGTAKPAYAPAKAGGIEKAKPAQGRVLD